MKTVQSVITAGIALCAIGIFGFVGSPCHARSGGGGTAGGGTSASVPFGDAPNTGIDSSTGNAVTKSGWDLLSHLAFDNANDTFTFKVMTALSSATDSNGILNGTEIHEKDEIWEGGGICPAANFPFDTRGLMYTQWRGQIGYYQFVMNYNVYDTAGTMLPVHQTVGGYYSYNIPL